MSEDIIHNHPEVISHGTLILRSDNCSEQYKSRFIFANLKQLAKKYNIRIIWFYGIPGHGKGLQDAMSFFGCKGPLRSAVLTTDRWFSCAADMVDFLRKKYESEGNKFYYLVEPQTLAKERIKKRDEFLLKGCKKMHMISVDPNGQFVTEELLDMDKDYLEDYDEDVSDLNVGDYEIGENNDDNDKDDNDKDDGDSHEYYPVSETNSIVYEIIEPRSYIGIRSPEWHPFENVFLINVISKGIASNYIEDTHGHQRRSQGVGNPGLARP